MMDKQQLDAYFEAHREEMVRDICRLVRIRSDRSDPKPGMPYGEGPAKALAEAMEIAREMGLSVTNYDNYVCTADLNGSPTELDILAHLDVVPVSDGWTVTAPFAPLEKDGRLYGRGAADDKGPAVAALYAVKAVKDLGVPLSKNVRVILGTDEECGSSDLDYYYAREKEAPKSFSPDADFPLINLEKGGLRGRFTASWTEDRALPRLVSADGGTKLNVVPDKASALVEGLDREVLARCCETVSAETGISYAVSEENGCLRIDAQNVGAAIASDNQEAYGRNGNARAAAAAKSQRCAGRHMLGRKIAAAGRKAKGHLGHRNDRCTVRRGDWRADNCVNVHHFLDFSHGFRHQVADGMLTHVLSPLLSLSFVYTSGTVPHCAAADTRAPAADAANRTQ